MRGRAHLLERERPARRHEDAPGERRVARGEEDYRRPPRAWTPRPLGDATPIADLQVRKPQAQAPRGGPLDPALVELAARHLHVVDLGEVVVHGAHDQAEL